MQTTIDALQAIVGPERVSVTEADRDQHAHDKSPHPGHLPDVVIWPQTTAEVSAILCQANEAKIPVTAWGAGTSFEGNPIPVRGGIVLDFRQMNQIVEIHAHDFQVSVQPGILYKDMNQVLARHNLFFAPDPGANASIGGMIANNAAGIRTVKYGATRDNVLAMEVVLANGQIIHTGSRSIKQSSGYNLTHLFIGSEGTLGIVTEATLKLAPLPEHFSAVIAAFPSVTAAAKAVFGIIGAGLGPAALELLDGTAMAILNANDDFDLIESPNLFLEFNGASEASLREELDMVEMICQETGCTHFQAGVGREARNRLWRARHRLFETLVHHYAGNTYFLTDVAVPISQYPTLVTAATDKMAEFGFTGNFFGHAGDGNLHTVIFLPPDDSTARANAQTVNDFMVETALSLGGTSTGEHGIGLGKQKYMAQEHGPALQLMCQIKTLLDPQGILNPGKVLGE